MTTIETDQYVVIPLEGKKQTNSKIEYCHFSHITKPRVQSLTFKATKIKLHLPSHKSHYLYITFWPLWSTSYPLIITPLWSPTIFVVFCGVFFLFTSHLSARVPCLLHLFMAKLYPYLQTHLKCYLLSEDITCDSLKRQSLTAPLNTSREPLTKLWVIIVVVVVGYNKTS